MEIDREKIQKKIQNIFEEKWAQDADPDEGKMHRLLDIPEDEEVTDHYDSGEQLAKDLVDEVGQDEASSMLAFAANLSGEQIFQDALEYIKEEIPNE